MGRSSRAPLICRLLVALSVVLGLFSPALPAAAHPAPEVQPQVSYANQAVSPTIGDVIPLRTRTSRTFPTKNGYQAKIYAGPVNYQDASGKWQPIDNTLVANASGYQNKANSYLASLPTSLTNPVKVSVGNSFVSFTLVGSTASVSTSANTASYANAFPGTTVTYAALGNGLKESLVLQNAAAPSSYTYTMQTSSDLAPKTNPSGGIDFVNSSGKVILSFAPPSMTDSAKSPSVSRNVTFTLTGNQLVLSADKTWLADPSRVYPVTIDPTVTANPTADCAIVNGSYQNTDLCGSVDLYVGNGGGYLHHTVFQFDSTSLPSYATIADASLYAYGLGWDGTGNPQVDLYQVSQSWQNGATWNTTNGTTPWTTPGGTIASTATSSTTVTGSGYLFLGGLTELVQGWVNGTIQNQGILLKAHDETVNGVLTLESTESTNGYPPYISVDYQVPLGYQGFWSYYQHGLSDRMNLSVNLADGNLIVHNNDLAIKGTGISLSLDRYYNSRSQISATDGPRIGNSWQLSPSEGVVLDTTETDGVSFYDPSGTLIHFHYSNGTYTSYPAVDATLVHNQDGTYTLTYHQSGISDNFLAPDANGYSRLKSIVDHNGNTISLAYNADGTLNQITDTQGRKVTVSYNAQGLISHIYDQTGQRTYQYTYDSSNNLKTYTDPLNEVTQYNYNTNNLLQQIIDPDGHQTNIVYDTYGRVTSISYVIDPNSNASITDAFTYNSGNTVYTDARTNPTTYDYDVYGRITKTIDANNNAFQTAWNSDNHVASTTDAYNKQTTYTYDSTNENLIQVQIPTGANVKYQYTDASYPYFPTSYTDAQGNVINFGYDPKGNLHTITDALTSQNTATINYNADGTVSSVVDFDGNTWTYTYQNGNLTHVTPPSVTMPSPGAPLGDTIITPDNLSRISQIQDGKGQVTKYSIDNLDRISQLTYADSSTIKYNFDSDGNVTSMVQGTDTTSYVYDDLNRLLTKTLPSKVISCTVTVGEVTASGSVCHTYDGANNLTAITDDGGTVNYDYNNLNELDWLTEPGSPAPKTTFTYDNNHSRLTTTFPGNTVQTVGYDDSQRITSINVVNGSNVLNNLTYNYQKNGVDTMLVQSETRSDGSNDNVNTTNTYDQLNRLTTWQVIAPTGSALQSHTYVYGWDGMSHRTSINADGAISNLHYNAAGEWDQTTASGQPNPNQIYWDAAGNMLGNNGFGGAAPPQTITYNAKNQLATITDTLQNVIPMTYSGPSQAERTSAGWVASNPDTPWGNNTYTYGSGMLSQTNSAGIDQGTIHYTYDAYGTPIAQRVPGATSSYYYLRDAGGSVLRMVDGSGNVLATYDYCPTGNAPGDITLTSIGQNNPIRYHSMMLDAGSKMYMAADGQYCDTNSGNCVQGGSETSGQNCLLPQGLQVFCNLFRPGPGGTLVVGPLKDFCPPFLNFCPDEGGGGASRTPPSSASGLGDLTNQEVQQIQSVADQAGRPIYVVGSAARGGRQAGSDIDYIVSPSSVDFVAPYVDQLPGTDPTHGVVVGLPNPYIGPAIEFAPGGPP